MAYETILFSLKSGVAKIVLNRPEKLNSFTEQMHGEVLDALDVTVRNGARVLLLTGAGRAFSTGQDLSVPTPDPGAPLERHYNPLIRALRALPCPFVCAVNGVAAGAGANLALAADLVVAAKSARFLQSFVQVGLVPDSGGSWTLPRLIGEARALGLMLTGQPLAADDAERWGLIWKAVEDGELMREADGVAGRLAQLPTKALVAMRQMVRGGWERSLDAQLEVEREWQSRMGETADYREGIAAFLEKRPPKFRGF